MGITMTTRINSSLVPVELNLPDNTLGSDIVHEPIPEGMQWPQWVNGQWQEYNPDNDPAVIATRALEQSYYVIPS